MVRKIIPWVGIAVLQLLAPPQMEARTSGNPALPVEISQDGRVVFVGNSLMEVAGRHGILEWMMSWAWPDKRPSFRNLGWSGDTVDGKARSYISQPPNPYELLIQQIDTLHPDLVVVGYGNVEAYEGPEGLDAFGHQLQRLITAIDSMGAQVVLVSTIPQYSPEGMDIDLTERNHNLQLYGQKIEEVARRQNMIYVDLLSALTDTARSLYTPQGIHLNGHGYAKMGELILDACGMPVGPWHISIDARQNTLSASSVITAEPEEFSRTHLKFRLTNSVYPVFVEDENIRPQRLAIRGLKRGIYALTVNGQHVLAASSSDLASGVIIGQGSAFQAAREAQEMYREIHDLYFWEYRPLNRTYLVGFRRYEQGQNTYELGLQSVFIERIEHKIHQINRMEPQIFEIVRINK